MHRNTLICKSVLRCVAPLLAVLVAGLLAAGCVEEYDFSRAPVERGTLGEESWRIVYKDAVRSPTSPDARATMLTRDQDAFVAAVDALVPDSWLTPLDHLLRRLGVLMDNDLVPSVTRRMSVLFDEIAADESLRLEWDKDNQGRFKGFAHPSAQPALLEHAVQFSRMRDLSLLLSRLHLEHDGFDDHGAPDSAESPYMTELWRLLADALRDVEVDGEPDRISIQLADLLLQQDPAFTETGTSPMWAARFDHRGLPLVRRDARGNLFSPFVDRDGDGLADVDADKRFVDFNGTPFDAPAFGEPNASGLVVRDGLGRAINTGELVFDYVDLNKTALAFGLRQNGQFAKKDVLFDLVTALAPVLPERVPMTDPDTGHPYLGYPADHPIMDLVWGLIYMLDFEGLDELLDTQVQLLADHSAILAAILLALEEFGDLHDANPRAALADGNTLGDDLVPIIAEIAETPGLLEAVLKASLEPAFSLTGPANVELLSHKGRAEVVPGGPYDTCFWQCDEDHEAGTLERGECIRACPRQELFHTASDHSQPPSVGNESDFQRMLALIEDSSGAPFEMLVTSLSIPLLGSEYDLGADVLPPLLRFPDAGVAFMDAVVGNVALEDYVTEEALANAQVQLLVDGIGVICDRGSILGRLISALTPVLLSVTPEDIMATCGDFVAIENDTGLAEDVRARKLLGETVVFLSLLTDVPFDAHPKAAQMVRFFNLANPRVDLELVQLSLSRLIDNDGYVLGEHNGDMLYAAEASGSLESLYPLIKAFSDRGKTPLLVKLIATLSYHWGQRGITYPRQDGRPAAQGNTGVVTYEPVLEQWLAQDRLIPALQDLAEASQTIRSHRGRALEPILEEVVRHIFARGTGAVHRDGHATSRRADGVEVARLNWFYVLSDALDALTARLDTDATANNAWDRAVDNLKDITIAVEDDGAGGARFKNNGGLALARLGAGHLTRRATVHRDQGVLSSRIQGYYGDLEDVMTGRLMPALFDLLSTVAGVPADKALFAEFLIYSSGDAVGVSNLLAHLYTLLVELTDEESFRVAAHFYSGIVDPDRAWDCDCGDAPLPTQLMQLLGDSTLLDDEDVVLQLLRGGFTRDPSLAAADGDPAGAYPMSQLGQIIKQYHRQDPVSREPLTSEDYRVISTGTARWLRDDLHGAEQVFDLVKSRKK